MAPEIGLQAVDLSSARPRPTTVDLSGGTARDDGTPARLGSVREQLAADPHSFGFFQAVRLLERLTPLDDKADAGDRARDLVRFRVNPALAFPASEIQQLELDEGPPSMTVNFMGLVGAQGVLPHYYSQLVAARLRARDGALAEFLDIFHHRILSLFYQAWRRASFTAALEDGVPEALGNHVADLIGLGAGAGHLPFATDVLRFRAGLLLAQPRGAVALEQLIQDYFDVPAQVESFVGGWYPLRTEDCCVLDEEPAGGNRLADGAVVGDEVWDPQARVRVRLGPLTRPQYETFLPGRSGHATLASLLRFFTHDAFDFELQPVLAASELTGTCLGGADEQQQLGWSTWICTAPRERDGDETLLTLQSGAAT